MGPAPRVYLEIVVKFKSNHLLYRISLSLSHTHTHIHTHASHTH